MAKEKKEVSTVKAPEEYSLVARFYSKDKEGAKVLNSFESKGATVEDLLNNITFPKGTPGNVLVTVTHNGRTHEANIAPFDVRAVLVEKSEFDFERIFRGV